MKRFKYALTLHLLIATFTFVQAQQISGFIYDEREAPIAYANIFVQQIQSGTSSDENGYYLLTLDPGEYNLIFSALGYESKEIKLFVGDEGLERSVILQTSNIELQEVMVRASKKDPAYAIIQKAAENKKKFLRQVDSYRTEIYVKATEEIEKHERKKEEKEEVVTVETNAERDPFAEAETAAQAKMPDINLLEMQVTLNYQQPNQYKEERNAYKAYGSKAGLYVPQFGRTDLNFYRNLINPQDLVEAPIISPISKTAVLSYKYKLIETKAENGVLVHKIRVTPRKLGNSTCKGFIYINEGIWNINRVDLEFPKGGLKLYDRFSIKQTYEQIEDSLWIPARQEFYYETKQGRKKTFKGNTALFYKNYEKDYAFPDKFFGNEIAITTEAAYERDSTYWQSVRSEPLSGKVKEMVAYRDSVEAIYNSPEYKDSLDRAFNKITFLELLGEGVAFRNHRKQHQFDLGSIPSLLEFEVVGGFRINPYFSYFKKWKDQRRLWTSVSTSVGLRNQDLQGSVFVQHFYDPKRIASFAVDVGRQFESFNPYDAILNQLSLSNYYLEDAVSFRHRFEVFNGFFFRSNFYYADRQSIQGLKGSRWIEALIDDNGATLDFEPHQAFVSHLYFSYTPFQRFMTEPHRKVILGSRWPTFSLRHRRGWKGPLGSDVNFDYLEFAISQDVQMGTLGNSKYRGEFGKFVNTKRLHFVDWKRFRESDRFLFSDPLHSFQSLNKSFTIFDLFVEAHHIHHFNGALINNIPLIKKLRIRTVAGAGFLWAKEGLIITQAGGTEGDTPPPAEVLNFFNDLDTGKQEIIRNFRYQEAFVGIERVFKLGVRRRLRIGAYGVFAKASDSAATSEFKISFDVIDTWDRNWDF
ncbi:MAG: DUF5686 and carboxypeptidase regulatory-like domain-containing protein [Bacteroidota bacterium]